MVRARSISVGAGLCTALLGLAACGNNYSSPPIYNLDRPSSIAFACYGDLRITNGEEATVDQELVRSAQPLESCRVRYQDEVPEGQGKVGDQSALEDPVFAAFALQPTRGTVALVTFPAQSGGVDLAGVVDTDPLTPGKNAIPIGTLPVGLVSSPSGCHLVSANAGSCDLSILDVNSALGSSSTATIERVAIENQSGTPILAKPRAMVVQPPITDIGYVCPDKPQGVVYIAYPSCHTVAAVEPASGQTVAGIRFDSGGGITLTDGDFTCPDECGGDETIDADPGAPRPVALDMAEDGSRLYVGADNSPTVTVIDLDQDLMPSASEVVELEGDIGITNLSASPVINMGGSLGVFDTGEAGQFQFVYAVATDRSVRVAEVGGLMEECDAQVDPRYLHDVTDVTLLSCMVVGDLTTPPRRPGAQSPGITLPRDTVPLDVAFASVDNGGEAVDGDPSPTAMVGEFAFVTASNGYVYVVNVDDDKYPDFENPEDPIAAFMPLAMAHQLRDFVSERNAVDGLNADGSAAAKCVYPSVDTTAKGPRLAAVPDLTIFVNYLAIGQRHLLPSLEGFLCVDEDEVEHAVPELAFAAPLETREKAYPDLEGTKSEQWMMTWEGGVSLDSSSSFVDGPPIRQGHVEIGGGEMALVDGAAPYCSAGIQPYDIVGFVGCNPALAGQCGVGEICYAHPESPTSITTGLCLPEDRIDELSGTCKDILTSRRRFTVVSANKDRLVLGERRRVLTTTPADGCDSDDQCTEMAALARQIVSGDHPVDYQPDPSDPTYHWACESDPTRAPGPDRCVMTCDTTDDCEGGWICSSGHCVEATIPPAQCMSTTQSYQLRVGEAFAVVGQSTGFLHHVIADPDTGECIQDPDANPLMIGRLPLVAPPCTGDGFSDLSPNPCSTTVQEVEEYVDYTFSDGKCVAPAPNTPHAVRTREAAAIRFENPAMRFHLVDPTTTGDLNCIGDRLGTWPAFRAVHNGFQIRWTITGGFFPMYVTNMTVAYPIDITPGPEGGLWIVDQGDVSSSLSTQGRVVHIDPDAAESSFAANILR